MDSSMACRQLNATLRQDNLTLVKHYKKLEQRKRELQQQLELAQQAQSDVEALSVLLAGAREVRLAACHTQGRTIVRGEAK